MAGADATSGCITLRGGTDLPPTLSPAERAELARIRTRRALEASPAFSTMRARVDALTCALEHRLPARPAPRPERRFLRAITWNIERGNRLDGVLAFFAEHAEARDADVVLLNEADIGMARSGNRNVPREIADALGFEYVFGNSYVCLGQGDARDGTHEIDNVESLHGNAILSRWPLRRAECFGVAITKDKFESSDKRLGHKKALWAEIETPLGLLAAVSIHLDPYASPVQRRHQMADGLAKVGERALGPAVLLGGDLNTTTYDLETIPRLCWNVTRKLLRGGFPHAIDHYMRPHVLYERPVFAELEAHGFDYERFNDMRTGSVRYEVGTFDSESKVRDHLPGAVAHLLRYKLKPWGGVAPLKIDWFAGRGLSPLGAGEFDEPGGRVSLAPRIFERARWQGRPISDHDPVLVDFSIRERAPPAGHGPDTT